MKAFIIDDAPIILSIIGYMLDKNEIDCAYTTDVNESMYKDIIEYQPDVIILDLYLKDSDGVKVAERIHQYEAMAHIPIIAVSHSDDLFDRVMLHSKEFADYLKKPVVQEMLIPLVKKYGSLGKLFNLANLLTKGKDDDSISDVSQKL